MSTRLHQPGWLSGAAHFIILCVAFEAESAEAWPYALIAMAGVSFFAWVANYRRYRQIHDLPTSRVASAAQGYVELVGRGELLPDQPVESRLSRRPCCWYSYEVKRKGSDDKWKTVEEGKSEEHFLLRDETGCCEIVPAGAEVLTHDHNTWTEGSYRYSEWLLLPGSVLYAIGEFTTYTADAITVSGERREIAQLITDWKRDPNKLLDRFDLDRDGRIDMKEWELARLQAAREVRRRRAAPPATEGEHQMRKPKDGRLYLLANELPDRLGARYRLWSWVHLAIFFGAGGTGLVML